MIEIKRYVTLRNTWTDGTASAANPIAKKIAASNLKMGCVLSRYVK
jgi:hypothetical protein